MKAIRVNDLYKTYPRNVEAVRGVSFEVEAGEIFGLLGPNGAGKSTTIRILVTLSEATKGSVEVGGLKVSEDPWAVRRRIGYVAQASGVDPMDTGRENLVFQGKLFGLPKKKIDQRVDELLDLFQLQEAAERKVRTYSGGMKRRLDVALGLLHEPEILFLDEPTTGLDPESRFVMWEELKRQSAENGLTILITTHYLEEADQMVDRLAIIDQGKIVGEGTPEALKNNLQGDMISLRLVEPERLMEAQTALAELAEIDAPMIDGKTLYAQVGRGEQALPRVLAVLEKSKLAMTHIAISRPSLDKVYLSMTGHAFQAPIPMEAEGDPKSLPAKGELS